MSSESSEEETWVQWFCSQRGHEFFCEISEDYIRDKFNLTNLSEQVPHYRLVRLFIQSIIKLFEALDMILNAYYDSDEMEDEQIKDGKLEKAARHLYGMIHARFILTNRGVSMMLNKCRDGHFGECPRVHCEGQKVLPVGETDKPGEKKVKLYCPKCNDIFNPSPKFQQIDGAYFGTGFPQMALMVQPTSRPQPPTSAYSPSLYGFRIHSSALTNVNSSANNAN
ncbi:unnamed protein product [Oikopleura dioica]|uniref:Casein kinase II subunit beta n=1 Tax=Oikopleura dioica TaxID=34765 RepID=E4XD68_OIKDI|nr:unnamed protein product [Oikopleura dioica]CBY32272.1 unnamed protein product [Oikopleura dioica]